MGGSLNVDATKGADFPIITSVAGVPYVTWKESDGAKFQIRVARFNGTSWEAVGASLNIDTAQAGSEPSIASVGGVPYVAWAESIATVNRDKVRVRRLNANGTTWDVVGTDLNFDATKQALAPRIADVGGVPYVTWFEGVAGGQHQVYVRRLNANGTTWDLVGTGSLDIDATKDALHPDIASIGGVPYVAWTETDTFDELHVKRFDGTNWVPVGGVLNVNPTKNAVFTPGIADVGGVPYVAWSESAVPTTQVVVRRFDGANWVSVGGTSNPDPTRAAFAPALAVVGGFPVRRMDGHQGRRRQDQGCSPASPDLRWKVGGRGPRHAGHDPAELPRRDRLRDRQRPGARHAVGHQPARRHGHVHAEPRALAVPTASASRRPTERSTRPSPRWR